MSDSADIPNPGPGGRSDGTARVLMLVGHEGNRRLLAEWLSERYEVHSPEAIDAAGDPDPLGDGAFDLCVVDGSALGRCGERLREWRAAAGPVALPVLLVVPEEAESRWYRSPTARGVVDEVITTPVRKAELSVRIEGLLERRELSTEGAATEARLRTLFRTVPDPMVAIDARGRIEYVNGAFCELALVDAAELVGERLDEVAMFPGDVVERILTQTEGSDPYTVSYTKSSGETRLAEINTAAVEGVDGSPAGTITVLRDVTERVRSYRELERQNERLDSFARTLAHEIRNPLNIASGYLDVARREGEGFETVERAHRRMERMIDELLRLARQGKIVDDFSPVPFGDVVEEAWSEIAPGVADIERDEAVGTIIADRGRLVGVLADLFRNAVRHAGEGVTIRVGCTDEGFFVEDDGPGIPSERRAEVFDPGHTTSEEGTGFGLTLVRQIVEAHGWSISVSEGETGGARFEVTGVAFPPGRHGR